MPKDKLHITLGIRYLKSHQVDFIERPYKYEDRGGTASSSCELGVEEHIVIKTLVMEDDQKKPLIILMHGDREVSTKELARIIHAKAVNPCTPAIAEKHTGYQTGGISPFGTRKPLPIYIESSILSLSKIFINAGKRGLLVEISPKDLRRTLNPIPVEVARPLNQKT